MKCAWQACLNILPVWLRPSVDKLQDKNLQEIRMRLDRPVEVVTKEGKHWIEKDVRKEDLDFTINAASQYSPWTSTEVPYGYITAPGGHRIGLCGEAAGEGGCLGVRTVTSLCICVARDFPGISQGIAELQGSILIFGRPGSGKTTLLRDLIREKSDRFDVSVAAIDERCELFPIWQNKYCFPPGIRTDILSRCKKTVALETILRTMRPQLIALDEITSNEDCDALQRSAWCGVPFLATAHADCLEELTKRSVYRKLLDLGIFSHFVRMLKDQTWVLERVVG